MRATILFPAVGALSCALAACAVDDAELSTTESDVTLYPTTDILVPADFPREHMLIFGPITHLEAGQSLVLNSRGVNTSSDDETRMQELTIHCANLADAANVTKIKSTQNREGTGEHSQYNRVMYVADVAGDYRCELWGAAKDFDGPNTSAYHRYEMDQTYLSQTVPHAAGNGWRWGTEHDALYPGEDPDARNIYIGPGLAFGSAEYVLHSSSIIPPANVSLLDFRFEIEMTTCKYGNSNCTSSTRGGFLDQWYGSGARVQIIVSQLDASGNVCATTTSPAQDFYITSEQVHAKAHALLDDVVIQPACARRFSAKALVTWTDRNPIEINYGITGSAGYSTGLAWGHN